MKSSAAAAIVLAFVLSVALFQTCFSLRCHRCKSENNNNQFCDQISDNYFLTKCRVRDSLCFTASVLNATGPDIKVLVVRDCITFPKYLEYKRDMEAAAVELVEFKSHTCHSDGCNYD